MKIKTLFYGLALGAIASLTFTNCASLTGYQTGRTVGKNNGEIMGSLNLSKSPDFNLDINFDDTTDLKAFYFPNLEVSGRYGILEKLDIGLRLNSNFNVVVDGRYQFIGDRKSPVAVATGLGVGTFGLIGSLWNAQIPLYISLHPSQNFAIYVNPRYTRQFGTGNVIGRIDYIGGNVGILIGRDVQFGFDAGLHNLGTRYTQRNAVLTFGVGVKVPLGQNDEVKKVRPLND